jgi:hypothetical protein
MTTALRSAFTLVLALMTGSLAVGCFVTPTRGGLAIVGLSPGVVVYRQPPHPQQTVMVRPNAPHPNAVWVEGHWQWDGRQHVWVDGYWAQYRPNQRYVGPRWERQGNGWVYYEGHYAPDR